MHTDPTENVVPIRRRPPNRPADEQARIYTQGARAVRAALAAASNRDQENSQ